MAEVAETPKTVSSERIECMVCGSKIHSVKHHLNRDHSPESVHPCTLEEYQTKWPNVKLLSDLAMHKLLQEKMAKSIPSPIKPGNAATGNLAPLAELFGFSNTPEVRTKHGKDIMVDLCEQTDYEEMIPAFDPNYVFNVDLVKTILMAFKFNIPIYLYGHAGVGKTSVVKQICHKTRRRAVRVQHTHNLEEPHIVGQWVVKKEQNPVSGEFVAVTKFELGPLPLAMQRGWVYIADEYDRASPSVSSIYQAVLEGDPLFIKEADEENRLIRPHPDFRFCATGNTNGSGDETGLYQATVLQDAATFERFGIVRKVEYMNEKEELLIIQQQTNILKQDAKKILEFCQKIRESYPQSVSLTIGPRVAITIGKVGNWKGDFKKGVELAYANRLPESEREVAMGVAQRIFG